VYCVEGVDGQPAPETLTLPAGVQPVARARPDLLGGLVALELGEGAARIEAIPYYAWNNRGLAPMAVWLKRASDAPRAAP